MARIDPLPSSDPPVPSTQLRHRIPLQHPSTVRSPSLEPLIRPSTLFTPSSSSSSSSSSRSPLPVSSPPDIVDSLEFWAGFFEILIVTIPFVFLYLLLDVLVYLQYSHRPDLLELGDRLLKAGPTLGLIVYYSNKYPDHFLTRSVLMTASLFAGGRLIWLVNKASWGVVTAQAPAAGTLWILTIIQLPLSRAVICLIGVAGWVWWTGLKLRF